MLFAGTPYANAPREVQEQIIRDQVEVLKPERQPPADEVFDLQFAGTIN